MECLEPLTVIRNFPLVPYVIHSKIGVICKHSAILAWRALIESDFESSFSLTQFRIPLLRPPWASIGP
jgi:hypothetical protein